VNGDDVCGEIQTYNDILAFTNVSAKGCNYSEKINLSPSML